MNMSYTELSKKYSKLLAKHEALKAEPKPVKIVKPVKNGKKNGHKNGHVKVRAEVDMTCRHGGGPGVKCTERSKGPRFAFRCTRHIAAWQNKRQAA